MRKPEDELYTKLRALGMNAEYFKQAGASREQLSELIAKATYLRNKYGKR